MNLQSSMYVRFSSAYFCYFLFIGGMIAFWPLWLKDKGFDPDEIGLLVAVGMATKIVAPGFWGVFSDRSGWRLTLLQVCTVLACFVFSLVYVQDDFFSLLMIIFVFTFFLDAVMPQLEVLTLTKLSELAKESSYTLVRLWGSISFIMAVVGLGFYFDYFPIAHLSYFLLSFLICFLVSSFFLPPVHVITKTNTSPQIWTVIKRPEVFGFLLVCCLLQASHSPFYTWFSVYLEELNYNRSAIGGLWTISIIAEISLFMMMRKVFDRFSLRVLLNITLLLTSLRWLLIGVFADYLLLLIFAQLLHAFSYSCFHAVAMVLVKRFFAGGNEGAGMGIFIGVSYGVGGTIGAYASGIIWGYSQWLCFVLGAIVAFLAYIVSKLMVKGPEVESSVA